MMTMPTTRQSCVHFDATGSMGYSRVIACFQPHTYSRTKALFDDFVEQPGRPDYVVLIPIYSAREIDDGSVSSEMLAEAVGDSCIALAVLMKRWSSCVIQLEEIRS